MIIRDLFIKSIDRPINGVIKADQRDAESVWQELDEYVVTKQLTEYFRRFFDVFLAAADNPNDPVLSTRMGVWVSGSFGCGKSHFIKILSYLLENIEAINPESGKPKRAVEFFDERKIKDPMLLGDIQRAVKGGSDVILFNIDAKADSKSNRDVILQVFLRVFNEKLGYAGDTPHIAEMERHLASKNTYDAFRTAFLAKNGSTWEQERDAVDFLRDDVVYALSNALNITEESAGSWFDKAREDYRINIESFANLIREYLDTKPKGHRIIFLVDEVGQFIGNNAQLMLTLQTITEQLGTLCQGRAWVIVTSQEDIDAAIGEANKAKSQDFSKIQGRFHTRLSLASSNTDEVIGERLLAKTEAAHVELRDHFVQKGDIINNQITFVGNSATLSNYRDAAEFVACYPYAPYQFQLLQKVFESIRKVGATGKHLSKGERSLLDAFQSAAKLNADHSSDVMVPLYDFYPSIESFIDTSAKRSIDEAPENPALEYYDIRLLKGLFLIRYIPEIIQPNADNLTTLCLDEIDADKLALKQKIQDSLNRLEQQRLINRNGDLWFFLTNEERDVSREISYMEISSKEKTNLLCELIYDEIFGSQTKIRFKDTKADYEINRLLDGSPWKHANNQLTLEIATPLGDDYEGLSEAKCILRSSDRVLIRLSEGERLDIELTLYQQIKKYIATPKANANVTPSIKNILFNRNNENSERYHRLKEQLSNLILEGDCYVLGQKPQITGASPTILLNGIINYLISNSYTKLHYLKARQDDPIAEIKAILEADNIGQGNLLLDGEEGNSLAINEVRDYLCLAASQTRVLLTDIVERFTGLPWGWKPEQEVVILIARLFMAGEIKLMLGGADLDPKDAIDVLTKSVRFKQVSVLKRKIADATSIKRARDLHQALFFNLGREDENGLVADFRTHLGDWQQELKGFTHASAAKYFPGKLTIGQTLNLINKQLAIGDSYEFIETLLTNKDNWLDTGDDRHDIVGFYTNQITNWRHMLSSLGQFADNHDALVKNTEAATALTKLENIRNNPSPYGQISQIEPLIAVIETINNALAQDKRTNALHSIDNKITEVQAKLDSIQAEAALRNKALVKLQNLKTKIEDLISIPQIFYLQNQAGEALDDAIATIEAAQVKEAPPPKVAQPGDTATVLHTRDVPTQTIKPTRIIRVISAADLATQSYLETESEADDYLARLKQRIVKEIRAGGKVRIQ